MRFQAPYTVRSSIAYIAFLVAAYPMLCPQAQAQGATGQTLSFAAQKALAAQQALVARDRTFELLGRQSGPVDAPNVGALLGAHDLDGWLWSRYHAVTADSTLSKAQSQRLVAGLVNQDLQLSEDALQSNDTVVRRRGLRVATIANLYAGSLTSDPRLQATLYQGFLLPSVDLAPRTGWGSGAALLEGASVAFGRSGRAQDQRDTLSELLQMQQGAGNIAGADMARVHLAVAMEGKGDLKGAFQQLDAITTPDLVGAKTHLKKLAQEIQAQAKAQPAAPQGTAPQGTAPQIPPKATNIGTDTQTPVDINANTPATPPSNEKTGAGQPATNGDSGATGLGQAGGNLSAGALGGQRLAQNAGNLGEGEQGAGQGENTGDDGAVDGESEAMRRVRLATQAAKNAQELSKKAGELATISLAKWLDAFDAQTALDAALSVPNGRAPARATLPGRPNAPQPSLLTLRTNAQITARDASDAAGDAKRASLAAQEASAEASRLALRVFIVDQDTPKAGENAPLAAATRPDAATQPPTATETQPVPLAPAPKVQTQ